MSGFSFKCIPSTGYEPSTSPYDLVPVSLDYGSTYTSLGVLVTTLALVLSPRWSCRGLIVDLASRVSGDTVPLPACRSEVSELDQETYHRFFP